MIYDVVRGALEQIKVGKIPAMHVGMNGWKYLKRALGTIPLPTPVLPRP
jgi:hypothetical protein